jgi:hypothetical protein
MYISVSATACDDLRQKNDCRACNLTSALPEREMLADLPKEILFKPVFLPKHFVEFSHYVLQSRFGKRRHLLECVRYDEAAQSHR